MIGPKAAAKSLCSTGEKMLAGEEDDLVVEEGLADGAQRLGVERVVEVDVADLGTDRAREGRDIELEGRGGGHGTPRGGSGRGRLGG